MASSTRTRRPDPWERLEQETDPAWAAFVAYRDLGPQRSTAKVAQSLGKSKTLMDGWSSKHSWVLRAGAWDREQDRQWQIELRVARKKAAERNIRTAQDAMVLAGNSLAKMVERQAELKPQDVARLMEVASRIEQLALGSPTEIHGAAPGDSAAASRAHVSQLSDEDRRARMLQLRRELDGRLDDQGEDVPA